MIESEPLTGRAGTPSDLLPRPNRGEPELIVLLDAASCARTAAERITGVLRAAAERRGRADFCTTGGGTPLPIYRLLATGLVEAVPWQQVHFWWGDDRFVPRGHPESNVTSLELVLLGGGRESPAAPLPTANIHPFPVDRALGEGRDAAWCAAQYAEEMADQLPLAAGNWPAFDLMLVGVGDDGHMLSVFPGSPALDSLEWTMAIPAPTQIGPHLPRVTLNPRLADAAPVMAVTWGSGKAEALGHVFGPVRDDRRWPVQRTRRHGAIWIVDKSAAAKIPRARKG